MNTSFLRAISPSVPVRDLEAAVWIAIVGICVAHLVVIPAIARSNPRHAITLLLLSCIGLGVSCFVVYGRPGLFYSVFLAYVAGFSVLSLMAGRKASPSARKAAVLTSIGLCLALLVVYLLAFTAR